MDMWKLPLMSVLSPKLFTKAHPRYDFEKKTIYKKKSKKVNACFCLLHQLNGLMVSVIPNIFLEVTKICSLTNILLDIVSTHSGHPEYFFCLLSLSAVKLHIWYTKCFVSYSIGL